MDQKNLALVSLKDQKNLALVNLKDQKNLASSLDCEVETSQPIDQKTIKNIENSNRSSYKIFPLATIVTL